MFRSVLLIVLLTELAHAQTKATPSTVDLINASKTCFTQKPAGTIECHYAAGKTLDVTIAGVGEADASVVFGRSIEAGDFYAKFQLALGCVLVKPGESNKANDFLDFAFISIRNGKVYDNGMECGQAK